MADNGHDFITTFFSHYGAMRYKKKCDEYQIKAKLMPVPRNLSSSCGTCVGSDRLAENVLSDPSVMDEIEQIFALDEVEKNGKTQKEYQLIFPK